MDKEQGKKATRRKIKDEPPRIEPVLVNAWPDAGMALGIGKSTLWELMRSGELKSVKIAQRRLVPVAEIHSYVQRLQEEAQSIGGDADAA